MLNRLFKENFKPSQWNNLMCLKKTAQHNLLNFVNAFYEDNIVVSASVLWGHS